MFTSRLKHADCLDLLRSIPTASISMVLTDPPYNIGIAEWDSQWKSEKDYLDWCKQWSEECARVLKPRRMMVVYGTTKTDTFLRYKLDVLNSIKSLHNQNEVVWSYNWGGRSKTNFARKHQIAWCYSKGPKFLFNADPVRIDRKVKVNLRTGEAYKNGTIPTCVWTDNIHTTSKEYVKWHPTQKPLKHLARFIEAYTRPGEVVLDPFSGSGSTLLAAFMTNRQFIGSEKSRDYYLQSIARYHRFISELSA